MIGSRTRPHAPSVEEVIAVLARHADELSDVTHQLQAEVDRRKGPHDEPSH